MPGPIDYSKLDIHPDYDTRAWWEGTKNRKYLVRACSDCGHKWFPPGPMCPKCRSVNLGWHEAAGRGVIHSYTVIPKGGTPAFAETGPYVVALIEFDDCRGPDGEVVRVGGVMIDDEEAVAIGLPVTVEYEAGPNPEFVFPRWKVSGTSPDSWKFKGA